MNLAKKYNRAFLVVENPAGLLKNMLVFLTYLQLEKGWVCQELDADEPAQYSKLVTLFDIVTAPVSAVWQLPKYLAMCLFGVVTGVRFRRCDPSPREEERERERERREPSKEVNYPPGQKTVYPVGGGGKGRLQSHHSRREENIHFCS